MTSKECTECRMYGNLIACTNTSCSKKYEPLPWYIAEHIAELKAENAKLKAREANYKEGLRRLERLMLDDFKLKPYSEGFILCEPSGDIIVNDPLIISAPNLAELIDNLLTQEQENE